MLQTINKITLLNLPNKERITRRYMCSYASPVSLFTPYELLSVGGIIREKLSKEIILIDAIAENLSLEDVIEQLEIIKPDAIVSITGFECFNDDILAVKAIKSAFRDVLIILAGHYPTLFPEKILEASGADFILHGEPDLSIIDLISTTESGGDLTKINGVSYFENETFHTLYNNVRINNINELPLPAHDLLYSDSYSEPLLPKPYAVIQSARGCPYQCNFCVKSFGSKLTEKSPERIIEEIILLVKSRAIKSFRFTDDTFTLNSKRVIKICQLLIENKLNYIKWACLSRVDNIDEEMILWMKKAGCIRMYFGIESGSQKILQKLNKNTDMDSSIKSLLLVKKYGIQTSGFFMLGIPGETLEDINLSIQYAKNAKLDFIAIGKFTPYPGTPFFELFKEQTEFSIYPYKLRFDNSGQTDYAIHEKYFYRKFYFRLSYLLNKINFILTKPKDSIIYFFNFISYTLGLKSNAINHIQVTEVK